VKVRQGTPYRRLATNGGEKYGLEPEPGSRCEIRSNLSEGLTNVFPYESR
jgi:hypothetical protein